MKILNLLSCSLLLLVGCADYVEDSANINNNNESFAHNHSIRSIEDALKICNQIAVTEENETRSIRKTCEPNVQAILDPTTRAVVADTIMYAVNYENNQGFVLAHARDTRWRKQRTQRSATAV
ncbi:MAG: hypothetical protein NC453_28730 [Muribaculum sp.]|nr:hypothetical protein [Muribaculum sp.]